MAELRVTSSTDHTLDVRVTEADKYSGCMKVNIIKDIGLKDIYTTELFLTPVQMDLLGRFLIRQATEEATRQEVQSRTAHNVERAMGERPEKEE